MSFPEVPEALATAVSQGLAKWIDEDESHLEQIRKLQGESNDTNAPVLYKIISDRCKENPGSKMAPWNSPEGAVAFRESCKKNYPSAFGNVMSKLGKK